MNNVNSWICAMRLHTLPVSIAGVITGGGCAAYYHKFHWLPFTICLLFAIGAQIAANFANEYFDYINGFDAKGRAGFRRGVTEGDLSAKSMLRATMLTLALSCALGCALIWWGGWWLLFAGIIIACFAIAYSAGPYPLSHHGLGELTVFIFFGIVPVSLTTYVQTESWEALALSLLCGAAIGLMGANVLIVNNYRDREEDLAAGKMTLAARHGLKAMENLYFVNGFLALLCIEIAIFTKVDYYWQLGALIYANLHYLLWQKFRISEGSDLNGVLSRTAIIMIGVSIWLLLALTL